MDATDNKQVPDIREINDEVIIKLWWNNYFISI
jgi:DNA polymerase III gamma/tau subunit